MVGTLLALTFGNSPAARQPEMTERKSRPEMNCMEFCSNLDSILWYQLYVTKVVSSWCWQNKKCILHL